MILNRYHSLKHHSAFFHRQVPQQIVNDAEDDSSSTNSGSDGSDDADGDGDNGSDGDTLPQPDEEKPNCCLAL